MGAPISFTCPYIDRAIKAVENEEAFALERLREIHDQLYRAGISEDILLDMSHLESYIKDITFIAKEGFENIRSDNAALREWGEELESKVEELEHERDELLNALL